MIYMSGTFFLKKMAFYLFISFDFIIYIYKLILSYPVYRFKYWGLERLQVENAEELVKVDVRRIIASRRIRRVVKSLGNELFNEHCCVPILKMIRKSFLALGNLFWESDIVVFKGKHKHILTYTHPIYDKVKQNSKQSLPCSSRTGFDKTLLHMIILFLWPQDTLGLKWQKLIFYGLKSSICLLEIS